MHRLVAAACALVALTSAPVYAQESETEPFDPRLAPYAAVELGAGQIDEDFIGTARAVFGMSLAVPAAGCGDDERCETLLRFALQAPVRLVLSDADPQQEGLIRQEDWDRPGDYLRIIRSLQYGAPSETFHLRGGELSLRTLGHGTIVDGYTNVVGPDRYEFGIQSNVNTRYGGVELLLDDVTEPEVVGGRLFVRPWGFTPGDELERLSMGMTLMADIGAPTVLQTTNGVFELDDDRRLAVAESDTIWAAGFDVDVTTFEGRNYAVTHYFDGNILIDSPGVHLGTLVDLPFDEHVQLELRGEFRALGRGYIPGYFSPLHEIDRFGLIGWGVDVLEPKAVVAASINDSTWGGLFGFDLRIAPWVQLGASYAGHRGPKNDTLSLRLDVGPVGPVSIGAYYYRQVAEDLVDAFAVDQALVVTEARVAVWGPIYLHGGFMRAFRPDAELGYEIVNDWNAGAGAAFTF